MMERFGRVKIIKQEESMNEITEKKTRKYYDETFQRSAVDLWLKGGRSAGAVAGELGVRQKKKQ